MVVFACLACVLVSFAYVYVAYRDVCQLRNENYALKQEEYAARERCDKLVREVNYVHSRLVIMRERHDCMEDEVDSLRTEMANIHASLKTNAKQRTLAEWHKLVGEITC